MTRLLHVTIRCFNILAFILNGVKERQYKNKIKTVETEFLLVLNRLQKISLNKTKLIFSPKISVLQKLQDIFFELSVL